MTATPLIAGVNAIMIGAGRAAPLIGVFNGALGWGVTGQTRLPQEFCRRLWDIDAAAEVTVLSPHGVSHGAVHVLVFPGHRGSRRNRAAAAELSPTASQHVRP